jgi:two-component system chemotaxis response regulator CheY
MGASMKELFIGRYNNFSPNKREVPEQCFFELPFYNYSRTLALSIHFEYKRKREGGYRMIAKSDMPSINEKEPEGKKPDGTPYRVLIIDDSMFVAKQLGQILTSEGFEIAGTASDGIQGIEKYKELYPNVDLVTMDITMPLMDGVSALEKILQFDKNAKVIMVSALGKEDVVKKSLLLGAKGYIVKPLDRKKVLERVVSILKR